MKLYKKKMKRISYGFVFVEADSLEEAKKKFEAGEELEVYEDVSDLEIEEEIYT